MSELTRNPSIFDTPATYRIRIAACLAESWSDALAGMAIESNCQPDGAWSTTLTGSLPDQAALAGVLGALHDWGMPLLSVERLDG